MKLHHLLLVSLTTSAASADGDSPRSEHGLVGYGIQPKQPFCAFACLDSISYATLSCSEMMYMDGEWMEMQSAACYASNDAFLQTLAWCMKTHCGDVPAWKLERFWARDVVGQQAVQPAPKYTYQVAVGLIDGTPGVVTNGSAINVTSVVDEGTWVAHYNTNVVFISQESQQERYGLVILLSGLVIPIGLSLLRFVPFPGALRSKFNALVINPPLFGDKHDTPVLYGMVQMPTRGQGLFLLYFIFINAFLSGINYQWINPNVWYPDNRSQWIQMLVSNRLGLLSFANLPLVFLFAGRNNVLLWLTNWSHSTFLLLHRWIAAIATLQAILHSIMYLRLYIVTSQYSTEFKLPYWIWGIVATIGMTVLFPASIPPIRRKFYELFLAWHQVVSILVLVGCYYHIIFEFSHQWGYETWIWVCMAVWGFDRLFRLLRVARNGVKTAEITVIDDDYLRVTIPGVTASGHAYLYFPTLTWRFWDNHPFSIANSMLGSDSPSTLHSDASKDDVEKQPQATTHLVRENSDGGSETSSVPHAGITFYLRTQTGLTQKLRQRSTLPVLLETGYSAHSPVSKPLAHSPALIAVAGGVGITAILPQLHVHPGRAKLYWACRSKELIDDVMKTGQLANIEKGIFLSRRMNVQSILATELIEYAGGEVCVLVSGPKGMIDEVRNTVGEIARRGYDVKVRLEVESFSW